MRKPKPGQSVIVKWLDSGAKQTGDPKDPRTGMLAVCEAHGRVLSCEKAGLKLSRGMDTTTLKLALNSCGSEDVDVDMLSIWWPSVVSIKIWKS